VEPTLLFNKLLVIHMFCYCFSYFYFILFYYCEQIDTFEQILTDMILFFLLFFDIVSKINMISMFCNC
jgi:hypothetical protein